MRWRVHNFFLVFLRILIAALSANQLHWLHFAFRKCISFSNCNLKCSSSFNSLYLSFTLVDSVLFITLSWIGRRFFFPIFPFRASNFVLKFSQSVIYILQSCSIFRRRFLFHYSAFTPETMTRTRVRRLHIAFLAWTVFVQYKMRNDFKLKWNVQIGFGFLSASVGCIRRPTRLPEETVFILFVRPSSFTVKRVQCSIMNRFFHSLTASHDRIPITTIAAREKHQ